MIFRLLVLSLVLGGSFLASAAGPVTVNLKTANQHNAGKALIAPLVNGVKITLDLHGLPPGEHAFHIHEKGSCIGPKFESAGGHVAPDKNPHGYDMEKGPHPGDMPNLLVGSDGRVKMEIINTAVTLTEGLKNSLIRPEGTSLVIHEKADDHKSQPAGNAGARIVCGVIK